jgi:hypothetical protein
MTLHHQLHSYKREMKHHVRRRVVLSKKQVMKNYLTLFYP